MNWTDAHDLAERLKAEGYEAVVTEYWVSRSAVAYKVVVEGRLR